MRTTWVRRLDPEPDNQNAVLRELADELLGQRKWPDPQVRDGVRRDVRSVIDDVARSTRLLSSAQESRDELKRARSAVAGELGRQELAGWAIAGALAAYLGLLLGLPGSGTGLAPVIIPALAIALGARVAWRLRRRHRLWSHADEAEERWRLVLREAVLMPFLVRQENYRSGERLELTMATAPISAVSYGHDPELAVSSAAIRNVAATARTIASGSIGISGPRGAGKSTILNKFDTRDDPEKPVQDIRVNVAAPVDYDAREFIIHLFTELCLKVQAEVPALSLAVETRRRLNELRFLHTYSRSWGSTLQSPAIFSLTGTLGRERAEQPAGLPALVAGFRAYSERVAEWNRSREDRAEGRVIICIDEMDKIRDSDRAEQFLNDIKAIFDVPGCLYLVSTSEDAMTVFASRTPAIRTAFDSAFDEIISVAPMTFTEAQDLLDLRVTGVPRPFLALCHVLAGGVPRELIRAARALIQVAGGFGSENPDLPTVTTRLIKVRSEVMRREAILQLSRSGAPKGILLALHRQHWPGGGPGDLAPDDLEEAATELSDAADAHGTDEWAKMCQDVAVALSFYATVIELFGQCPDRVASSLRDKRYPRIDDLAIARHAMRMNSELARGLLAKYRTDYQAGNRSGRS